MDLNQSTVHRGLDVRMKVGGLEALDLIAILILAGILNLFQLPELLVLGIPLLCLIALYFGKKNKPEGFLLHLIKFYTTPGFFSAGQPSEYENQLSRKIYETEQP